MSKRASEMLRVLLRCDRFAPRRAREAVGGVESIGPARDDALLVTSELVSNAVLHAGCGPDDEIELVAERIPRGLRISVGDVARSGSTPTVREEAPFPDSGGIGLWLVRTLARQWGTDRTEGLRVWAELGV